MPKTDHILKKLRSGRSVIMGIVNVTPDSFSENGVNYYPETAIKNALQMIKDGADILDIGGESTRPGAEMVPPEEEMRRVIPVIEGLKDCSVPISIDTRNAKTMQAALDAGTSIINDVTALTGDPDSLDIAAGHDGLVCLMHMQGDPQTMQTSPQYQDVVTDVIDFLKGRINVCLDADISKDRLIIDPGIGFGKTLEHNLALFHNLDRFETLGVPVLLGASRKSFIAKICGDVPADQRLPGSLAACLWGYEKGVRMFRVHDVKQTAQALKIWHAFAQ